MALPILFRSNPRRVGFRRALPRRLNLSAEMDQLFEDFWRGHAASPVASAVAPRVDLVETDEELRVSAELPGLEADDIGVEFKDGVLHLRGEKNATHSEGEAGWHRAERSYGAFARSIRVPVEVDADAAKASYRNGVLEIAFPKAESARVREIPVEAETAAS